LKRGIIGFVLGVVLTFALMRWEEERLISSMTYEWTRQLGEASDIICQHPREEVTAKAPSFTGICTAKLGIK